MAKVEILESTFVVPSAETPRHNIWLSNLDLLLSPRYTTLVSLYRRPAAAADAPDFFSSLPLLKAALADALVPFYPFAGRVALDPSGRLELRCSAEGVLLVAARSGSTLEAFGDLAKPSLDMARLLLPDFEHSEPPPPAIPIMFQFTYFACGSVCLGIALHHTVTDAPPMFRLVNTWAELTRGVRRPITLSLDRTVLRARSPPIVRFDHVEYRCVPRRHGQKPTVPVSAPPPATDTLRLTKNQVATLLNRCSVGGDAGKGGLSVFQVVMAYVWQCVCKVRELKAEEETRLYMFASVRHRLRPPLPLDYFGNALVRTSAAAAVGHIMSNPLRFAAEKIRGATARLNDEYVRSIIDYLELLEDINGLHVESRQRTQTELWGVGLLEQPLYEADFGWGKPVFFSRAHLNIKGLVYVQHGADEKGDILVSIALEPENMSRFKKVFYEDIESSGVANAHPRL